MNISETVTPWQQWLQHPQRMGLRRLVFQIHLWSGIGLGLYVFFISLTGSVLVYRNEMYVAAAKSPAGIRFVSALIDIHTDFLAGTTGRILNGIGALAVLLMAFTGLVLWWPGIARWRRSLVLRRGVGWKRFNWDLHSAIGFWSFSAIVVFALSGVYLCFPVFFYEVAEWIEPTTAQNLTTRVMDEVLYWLAFLHFGRINGIGISCEGPGVCDQTIKAIWAVFGIAPAVMFVTGATMWWNRVVRPWRRRK